MKFPSPKKNPFWEAPKGGQGSEKNLVLYNHIMIFFFFKSVLTLPNQELNWILMQTLNEINFYKGPKYSSGFARYQMIKLQASIKEPDGPKLNLIYAV